jgi:hypothetical protein
MYMHSHRTDDLNELERRLSSWQPAADCLDADAVLFAAGRASARPGPARLVWPALTGLLSVLCVALGLWLTAERDERLALARQLSERQSVPINGPTAVPAADVVPTESDEPAPDSYFVSHRALEQGLDAWPLPPIAYRGSSAVAPASSAIYRVGRRDLLLEP